MQYDFKPGERIAPKGVWDPAAYLWFVAQIGDTVYATSVKPGVGANAAAYTGNEWERYVPFFQEGKTYINNYTGVRVTIHEVRKVGKHKYAAGLSTGGALYLSEECDFENWTES